MSDVLFEFRVTGHEPRPWATGPGEWRWRGEVAAAIRATAERAGRSLPLPVGTTAGPTLAIEIVFRMTPTRFPGADLDNLAKPVLDTLFRAQRVQAPEIAGEVSGVLFGFDDSRVVRLLLEKRRVEIVGDAGIDLRVESRLEQSPTDPKERSR